jgi:hypothetical protein
MPKQLGDLLLVYETDYREVDDFISDYFGKNYEMQDFGEYSNGDNELFNLKKGDDYDCTKNVMDWLLGNRKSVWLRDIMQYLVNHDVILSGNYIINISW